MRVVPRKPDTKPVRVERMVRFPPTLYQDLTARAEAQNRSIQGQIIVAIEEHLRRKQ